MKFIHDQTLLLSTGINLKHAINPTFPVYMYFSKHYMYIILGYIMFLQSMKQTYMYYNAKTFPVYIMTLAQ